MKTRHNFSIISLAVILAVGLLVRLYRINWPLADWHSWRQVDTAGVTREYVKDGVDLLHPRYMDLSSIPSGLFNPQGWRMVEFPFANALVALIADVSREFGVGWDLVMLERLVSVGFSLGSVVLLYAIVKELLSEEIAVLAAVVFAMLPFNIYYSQAVLPEPKLVFFSLAALWFFIQFINKRSLTNLGGFVVLAALATLLKPTWLIVFGPSLVWMTLARERQNILKIRSILPFIISGALALTPFLFWRLWIRQFPSGIPASDWLFNAGGIRLRPAWFQWLFADRLGRLILGYWGMLPFGLGLLAKSEKKEQWFFHWWLFGGLAYLVILASGNVTHDYYQVILIPAICVFVAKGLSVLLHPPKSLSLPTSYMLFVMSAVFMLAFGWYHVRDFFNINHPEIVEAGREADRILPSDAIVIAPYGGDTAFLYQIDRKGWPIGGSIGENIKSGATYYISVNFDDETKNLMSHCSVLEKTSIYVIIDLSPCRTFFESAPHEL